MELYKAMLPAVITIIGNLIFYAWIKNDVDNQLEKMKISYTGVFKEKIEIYKQLLRMIFEIKQSVSSYQYFGSDKDAEKIKNDINDFIRFYLINQPFLSEKMLEELKKIRIEFQSIFDNFYVSKSISQHEIDSTSRKELVQKFFEAGNKLKKNQPFKEIEETIINEMRTDLKVFQ